MNTEALLSTSLAQNVFALMFGAQIEEDEHVHRTLLHSLHARQVCDLGGKRQAWVQLYTQSAPAFLSPSQSSASDLLATLQPHALHLLIVQHYVQLSQAPSSHVHIGHPTLHCGQMLWGEGAEVWVRVLG